MEDHGRIGSDTQKGERAARGRKTTYESRAPEFRRRLVEWKQMPESLRPPLRALARELDTSHQLLGYFLEGLEEWDYAERCHRAMEMAQKKATEIRARARAENRELTRWECYEAILAPASFRMLDEIMRDAERGPLYYDQIKILKLLARELPLAQEFLQKCSQQKGVRRRTFDEDHPEWRINKLISRVEERGGILWLDDEGQVLYSIPNMDAKSRALMTKIWEHREEVKRIIGDQVTRLKEQGKYEEIKSKICQHFPASMLSPLEPYSSKRRKTGNSAGTREKERGAHAVNLSTLVSQ